MSDIVPGHQYNSSLYAPNSAIGGELPMISVTVVTYKHGNLLFETIDSIFAQFYPSIQLIIAEDGAPGFEPSAINAYIARNKSDNIKEYIVIHAEKNRGTVRNINMALDSAHGEYIKIIAGDDTYPNSQVFKKQAEHLLNNPQDYIVIGNTVECDANMHLLQPEGITPIKLKKLLKGSRQQFLRYVCKKEPSVVSTQVSCYRKAFFENYGRYDERYRLIEDIPMAVRIISGNISIGYVDWSCVNHRKGTGVSTSKNAFDVSRIGYYEDLFKCYENAFLPIENAIGKNYVRMRYQLLRFRIEYSKLKGEQHSIIARLKLIVTNTLPILYYALNNVSRISFYFGHSQK